MASGGDRPGRGSGEERRGLGSRLSDWVNRVGLGVLDLIRPTYVRKRTRRFGIGAGTSVVDYGCGPGRYTVELARQVGPAGKVVAVDTNPWTVEGVRAKCSRLGLGNVTALSARGFDSGVADGFADCIVAIDMFFLIRDTGAFFEELRRIAKPGCILIIDGGHISLAETRRRIEKIGLWRVTGQDRDFLRCSLVDPRSRRHGNGGR